jgi:hypothetical protein
MTLPAADALSAKWSGQGWAINRAYDVNQLIALLEWRVNVSMTMGKKILSEARFKKKPIANAHFGVSGR